MEQSLYPEQDQQRTIFFKTEEEFKAARSQASSETQTHFFYALQILNCEVLSELHFIYIPEDVWGLFFDPVTGEGYQIFESKEEALSSLSVDITSDINCEQSDNTVAPMALTSSSASLSKGLLPIQNQIRSVCEFFPSKEEFLAGLKDTADTIPALTWGYACRVIDTASGRKYCKETEYLHITLPYHSKEFSQAYITDKDDNLFFVYEGVGTHLFYNSEESLSTFLDQQAQACPSSVLSVSDFLALAPQPEAVTEDHKRNSQALSASVTPITLEEAKTRIPQGQQEKRSRWKSWHLLSQDEIRQFEDKVREVALITSGLILPTHLIPDGLNHSYIPTQHDREKGREEGNTANKGSYKYIVEPDGFRKVIWNAYNGDGGCYTIAQFFKDEPSQELTDRQRREFEERAKKKQKAYEQKARILEEQEKKNRAEWRQKFQAADGTIQGCLYLKAKNFPLDEIESVLARANVRYDKDGTLRIPYLHSSPEYGDSYAGHQAVNPSSTIVKDFGRGADCGKDGHFIWMLLPSDCGSSITYLCEGFGTGVSIWLATHANVIVCFNAAGLVKVAKGIADKKLTLSWQISDFYVCADNDCQEDRAKNTGLNYAIKAAQILGCKYFLPQADGRKCDFDDLRMWKGIEAVKSQLQEGKAITPPVVDGCDNKTANPARTACAENPMPTGREKNLASSIYEKAFDMDGLQIVTGSNFQYTDFPDFVYNPDGLIGEICAYIKSTSRKYNPIYAFAGALTLISSLLLHRVKTPSGILSNIFSVIVGDSGSGKNEPKNAIRKILGASKIVLSERLGNFGLNLGLINNIASGEAVISNLSTTRRILFNFDEFGALLDLSQNPNGSLKQVGKVMLEWFSHGEGEYRKPYSDQTKNVVVKWGSFSIFGTTTPQQFWDALSIKDTQDGLVARTLIFEDIEKNHFCKGGMSRGGNTIPGSIIKNVKDIWEIEDGMPKWKSPFPDLQEELYGIHNANFSFEQEFMENVQEDGNSEDRMQKLEEAKKAFLKAYEESVPELQTIPLYGEAQQYYDEIEDKLYKFEESIKHDDPAKISQWSRVFEQGMKLATFFAFSKRHPSEVLEDGYTKEDLQRGFALASILCQRTLQRESIYVHDSKFDEHCQTVLRRIPEYTQTKQAKKRGHENKGAPISFITRSLKLPPREVEEVLLSLIEQNRLRKIPQAKNNGRSYELYAVVTEDGKI